MSYSYKIYLSSRFCTIDTTIIALSNSESSDEFYADFPRIADHSMRITSAIILQMVNFKALKYYFKNYFAVTHSSSIFAVPKREISSAGSEHLPYKQGVTGSNPVSPTE